MPDVPGVLRVLSARDLPDLRVLMDRDRNIAHGKWLSSKVKVLRAYQRFVDLMQSRLPQLHF